MVCLPFSYEHLLQTWIMFHLMVSAVYMSAHAPRSSCALAPEALPGCYAEARVALYALVTRHKRGKWYPRKWA